MADIDQTNVYNYKGDNYCVALTEYLRSKGLDVFGVELTAGFVMMYQGTTQHGFAQYCQWGRMAKCLQMRKEM